MNIINITIEKKEYFFEKYNDYKVSKELINYLIKESINKQNIKVIINSSFDINFKQYIIEGLNQELENNLEQKRQNNLFQILLIFLGIFFICLSVIFKDFIIWHEVMLIGGWVPIWEAIDIELFRDSKAREKRYTIKKLLNSEIEIKKYIK